MRLNFTLTSQSTCADNAGTRTLNSLGAVSITDSRNNNCFQSGSMYESTCYSFDGLGNAQYHIIFYNESNCAAAPLMAFRQTMTISDNGPNSAPGWQQYTENDHYTDITPLTPESIATLSSSCGCGGVWAVNVTRRITSACCSLLTITTTYFNGYISYNSFAMSQPNSSSSVGWSSSNSYRNFYFYSGPCIDLVGLVEISSSSSSSAGGSSGGNPLSGSTEAAKFDILVLLSVTVLAAILASFF